MVALTLALGVATASASSVDVIWQVGGTGTTTVTASSVITGNIVLTIGGGDTGIGAKGAGIELSADATPGATITGFTMTTLAGWIGFPLGAVVNPHSENVNAQGDLFGFGASLAPGSSTIIGTITVHAGATSTVIVSTSGPGDDLIANTVGGSVKGQFSFGGGNIIVPEPTTASLLGLGLIGLTVAGRQRKS
jgi:hypothetical protein